MKNLLVCFFFFWSGLSFAQSGKEPVKQIHSGIKLISTTSTLFDGSIACATSFDVIAYTDYHSRISNNLSPFLILAEPVAHNLLMSHKYVHFISSGNSPFEQFSIKAPENSSMEDDSSLDQAHYSSLFRGSDAPPKSDASPPKVNSAVAMLCIMAYQIATADHNWGGYPADK